MPLNNDALSKMEFVALPKVELHVHLDCCLSRQAVSALAGPIDREAYQRRFMAPFPCRNLADFLSRIDASLALLQNADALQIAVSDLFDQFCRDNVIYGEIRFAPMLHTDAGLTPTRVVSVVEEAVSHCSQATGIESRVILCALRNFSSEQSMETVRLADQFHGTCVAGLDLAADEAAFPLTNHISAFVYARERGIFRTAHAGEARGAESVRETLEHLHPTRIGHGVRSIEDPALMAELMSCGTHLEVCPSSNIQIGLFDSIACHPVNRLLQAGISVGINTDSRTLTGVNLADEYERLHSAFGWGIPEFFQCNRNSLAAAFLNEDKRGEMQNRLTALYTPWLRSEQMA